MTLLNLRDIGAESEGEETLRAGIAASSEAITEVGEATDALLTQSREPCPQQVS